MPVIMERFVEMQVKWQGKDVYIDKAKIPVLLGTFVLLG